MSEKIPLKNRNLTFIKDIIIEFQIIYKGSINGTSFFFFLMEDAAASFLVISYVIKV